jgi:hypothetical protein
VAKKNVTITLDADVARWARIAAAERDTSVSALVGEWVRQRMAEDDEYQRAMSRYGARPVRAMRRRKEPLPSRAELHDRRLR